LAVKASIISLRGILVAKKKTQALTFRNTAVFMQLSGDSIYCGKCVKIIKVFSPTDAQLDSLKNHFKFALKLTLKGSYMFRCEKHHHQGAHYLSLAKVTIVKIS
jgi:hypothetical protein